jgi:acetone carboxylase alpha subunit
MCGGYPAPSAYYQYDLRVTDIGAVARNGGALPHSEGDPAAPSFPADVSGVLNREEGGFIGPPFQHDDVFVMNYLGGSGYGDPIDRDPAAVARDVAEALCTRERAAAIFGVSLQSDEGAGVESDPQATTELRAQIRRQRLSRAVPTAEWLETTRERIRQGGLHPEIARMYREMMGVSRAWRQEFIRFWDLPDDFELQAGAPQVTMQPSAERAEV